MTGQGLRPMGVGDIFDEGFDLYKRNLSFFILVSALIIVPGLIIQQIIRSTALGGGAPLTAPPNDPSQYPDWAGSYLSAHSPFLTSGATAYMLSFGALVAATSSRYIKQSLSLGGIYMLLLRRSIKLIITSLLGMAAVTLAFAFCVIPAFSPIVYFVFTAHCVMIENPRLIGGIGRSVELVNGNWWRTFGFLIMVYLLYAILYYAIVAVVTYLIALIVNSLPGTQDYFGSITNLGGVSWKDQGIDAVGVSIASLLVTPFIVCVLTVYYYDLRVRTEAYDVLALARELNYAPLSELGPYLPSAIPPGSVMYTQNRPQKPAKIKGKR